MADTRYNKRIVRVFTLSSLASTNALAVFPEACKLLSISVLCVTGSNRTVKIFNKATAPTPGTDVPVLNVYSAANTQRDLVFPDGLPLSAGLALAITGTLAWNSTTVVAANDVFVTLTYAEV